MLLNRDMRQVGNQLPMSLLFNSTLLSKSTVFSSVFQLLLFFLCSEKTPKHTFEANFWNVNLSHEQFLTFLSRIRSNKLWHTNTEKPQTSTFSLSTSLIFASNFMHHSWWDRDTFLFAMPVIAYDKFNHWEASLRFSPQVCEKPYEPNR